MMTTIQTMEDIAFHHALTASGRSPEIPEASDAYGWLIGSWELDVRHYRVDVTALWPQGRSPLRMGVGGDLAPKNWTT
jgi:hypothetical protein